MSLSDFDVVKRLGKYPPTNIDKEGYGEWSDGERRYPTITTYYIRMLVDEYHTESGDPQQHSDL